MADLSFDVVIIGGGCKGLATGAYLAKYGGMSVGIFEELHELGGGLAGEQPAPGLHGNPHSNSQMDWFYKIIIKDDLPELWEEGFKTVGRMTVTANLFPDDTCLTIYGFDIDPDGSRSAAQAAPLMVESCGEEASAAAPKRPPPLDGGGVVLYGFLGGLPSRRLKNNQLLNATRRGG